MQANAGPLRAGAKLRPRSRPVRRIDASGPESPRARPAARIEISPQTARPCGRYAVHDEDSLDSIDGVAVMKALYTTREAGRRLEVSAQTIQQWVDAGHLPAWKTKGGHRRVDAEAVEAIVQRRPVQPMQARIMMVGGEATLAERLRDQLRSLFGGAELQVFGDGVSALLAAGRAAPSLMIVDAELPGVDVAAMACALAAHAATRATRLVLLGKRPPGLPSGVALLSKPVSFSRLWAALAS
jgi:excisionase family DNA binding protein